MNFLFKKKSGNFSIFGQFDPQRPPLARCTKLLRAWGPHLRVPAPPPGLTPSPNFWHHILFSLGGRFGTIGLNLEIAKLPKFFF